MIARMRQPSPGAQVSCAYAGEYPGDAHTGPDLGDLYGDPIFRIAWLGALSVALQLIKRDLGVLRTSAQPSRAQDCAGHQNPCML